MSNSAPLEGQVFPITINIPVAWGDLDHFGHVNNVVYFRYFQDARIAYFKHIGLMAMYNETKKGPILHSTAANFQKELGYPDDIIVGTTASSMRNSSFVLDYKLESKNSGLVATGTSVIVMLGIINCSVFSIFSEKNEALASSAK